MSVVLYQLGSIFMSEEKRQQANLFLRIGWDGNGTPVDPGELQRLEHGEWY